MLEINEDKNWKKICVVTGANSGIGYSICSQLVQRGHQVVMACRHSGRGKKAYMELKTTFPKSKIKLLMLDLSNQASIYSFVEKVEEKCGLVDVLIHNAACFDITQKKVAFTSEDRELTWATNHLGPVLLTKRLEPLLRKSSQARVITVSSKGLLAKPFLKVDFQDPEFRTRKFSVPNAYYQSKLAQVMYTYWLSEKFSDSNITVNCCRVTNVQLGKDRLKNLSKFMRFLYSIKSKFAITPHDMARVYYWMAMDLGLEHVTGKYFNEHCEEVSSRPFSLDAENIDKLMELTFTYLPQKD